MLDSPDFHFTNNNSFFYCWRVPPFNAVRECWLELEEKTLAAINVHKLYFSKLKALHYKILQKLDKFTCLTFMDTSRYSLLSMVSEIWRTFSQSILVQLRYIAPNANFHVKKKHQKKRPYTLTTLWSSMYILNILKNYNVNTLHFYRIYNKRSCLVHVCYDAYLWKLHHPKINFHLHYHRCPVLLSRTMDSFDWKKSKYWKYWDGR